MHEQHVDTYIDVADRPEAIAIIANDAMHAAATELLKCYLTYHDATSGQLTNPTKVKCAQLGPYYERALEAGRPHELALSRAQTALISATRNYNPDTSFAYRFPCLRSRSRYWQKRTDRIDGLKQTLNLYMQQIAQENGVTLPEKTDFFFSEYKNRESSAMR